MLEDSTLSRMGLPAKSPQAILWGPRKEGGATFPARRTLDFTLEPAAPSERVLYEFTYNSETNGDGVKMFNSDECVRVEHLRPHAPSEMWTPA